MTAPGQEPDEVTTRVPATEDKDEVLDLDGIGDTHMPEDLREDARDDAARDAAQEASAKVSDAEAAEAETVQAEAADGGAGVEDTQRDPE